MYAMTYSEWCEGRVERRCVYGRRMGYVGRMERCGEEIMISLKFDNINSKITYNNNKIINNNNNK